jgi:membrane-associated HD superfamily phosphohydrolase
MKNGKTKTDRIIDPLEAIKTAELKSTGKIRAVIDIIDELVNESVGWQNLLKTLNANGIQTTKRALQRHLREHRETRQVTTESIDPAVEQLRQALKEIPETIQRTKLARAMGGIDKKLKAGATIKSIHEALSDAGITVSYEVLRGMIHRYRNNKKEDATKTPDIPTTMETQTTQTTATKPVTPSDIDAFLRKDWGEEAAEMEEYERIGKLARKERKRK